MPFEESVIEAAMAKYQGIDRQALVDCAGRIRAKLGEDTKYTEQQIVDKAARRLQAEARKAGKAQAPKNEEQLQYDRDRELAKSLVPKDGDYVPEQAMVTQEYVRKIAVINPETDFYLNKQTGRQTLNKRGLDKVAVAMRIHTEIEDIITTDERVIVTVKGWIGDRDNPVVETEDAADYVFRDKHNDFVFSKMEKREILSKDVELDEDGKLWFKPGVKDAEMRNIQLRKAVLKEKDFAFRVTVSKARERVIRTLSGTCDLDDKEAQMLEREYKKVAGVI